MGFKSLSALRFFGILVTLSLISSDLTAGWLFRGRIFGGNRNRSYSGGGSCGGGNCSQDSHQSNGGGVQRNACGSGQCGQGSCGGGSCSVPSSQPHIAHAPTQRAPAPRPRPVAVTQPAPTAQTTDSSKPMVRAVSTKPLNNLLMPNPNKDPKARTYHGRLPMHTAGTGGNPGFPYVLQQDNGAYISNYGCQGTLVSAANGICVVSTATHCFDEILTGGRASGRAPFNQNGLNSPLCAERIRNRGVIYGKATVEMANFGRVEAILYSNPERFTEDSGVFAFSCPTGAGSVPVVPIDRTPLSPNEKVYYSNSQSQRPGLYTGQVYRTTGNVNGHEQGYASDTIRQNGPGNIQGDSGGGLYRKTEDGFSLVGNAATAQPHLGPQFSDYSTNRSLDFGECITKQIEESFKPKGLLVEGESEKPEALAPVASAPPSAKPAPMPEPLATLSEQDVQKIANKLEGLYTVGADGKVPSKFGIYLQDELGAHNEDIKNRMTVGADASDAERRKNAAEKAEQSRAEFNQKWAAIEAELGKRKGKRARPLARIVNIARRVIDNEYGNVLKRIPTTDMDKDDLCPTCTKGSEAIDAALAEVTHSEQNGNTASGTAPNPEAKRPPIALKPAPKTPIASALANRSKAEKGTIVDGTANSMPHAISIANQMKEAAKKAGYKHFVVKYGAPGCPPCKDLRATLNATIPVADADMGNVMVADLLMLSRDRPVPYTEYYFLDANGNWYRERAETGSQVNVSDWINTVRNRNK